MKRLWTILYFLITILLGASYIIWAYTGYSMGEPDCLWFLPPAVSHHLGNGLYNFIHEPSQIFDPAHLNRFLFYPPGFQIFLSTMLIAPTGLGALITVAVICFAILLLSSCLIYKVLIRENESFTWQKFLLGIFALTALSTYLAGFRLGRPDFLATFYVLLIAFIQLPLNVIASEGSEATSHFSAWERRKNGVYIKLLLTSILIALIAFTHPVAALFTSSLLGIYYSTKYSWKQTLFFLTFICGFGLILFIVFMSASPHGLIDSIHGIILHSQNTMIHGTVYPPLKYLIFHTYATCYGLLFLAFLAAAAWILWKRKEILQWKIGVIIFSLIFFFFTCRFVMIAWDRSYNLWIFTPLMLAMILFAFTEIQKRFLIPILVLFLLCSIGYFHTSLLFPFYLKYGFKYENARADFQKLQKENPDKTIGVSKSFWILSEDYKHMRSFGLNPYHLWSQPDFIFLQQRYALKPTPVPQKIKNYKLLKNNFSPLTPKIFGIQLSPTMPGYFYAVYEKK